MPPGTETWISCEFAQPAVAGQLARPAEVQVRPLLRAELEHDAGLADGRPHPAGLRKRHSHRLLVVDVLAVQNGVLGGDAVPVDGQGHQHGVDGGIRVQLAKIRIDLHIGAAVGLGDETLRTFDVSLVHVADGRHAYVAMTQEIPHVALALSPDADDAERELVRGCGLPRREQARRHHEGRDPRRQHGLEKTPSRRVNCRLFHRATSSDSESVSFADGLYAARRRSASGNPSPLGKRQLAWQIPLMSWRAARRRSNLKPWDGRLLRFARNDTQAGCSTSVVQAGWADPERRFLVGRASSHDFFRRAGTLALRRDWPRISSAGIVLAVELVRTLGPVSGTMIA